MKTPLLGLKSTSTTQTNTILSIFFFSTDHSDSFTMEIDIDGFGDLVQQAEQLTAEVDSGGELPRVERNLHQIMEAARRMAHRAPPLAQDSTDIKA